nr:hypothetical protein [Alkalicoccobacillus plakortidis]
MANDVLFELEKISFFQEIKKKAKERNFIVEVSDCSHKIDIALASHYVDYAQKIISIEVPFNNVELNALFVHELIHAELFLKGFPRILRYPDIEIPESLDYCATMIENMAHHYYLYPRLQELGFRHSYANESWITDKVFGSQGEYIIDRALNILECDYRELGLPPDVEKFLKNRADYSLYRRFKRLYKGSDTPRLMRTNILSIIREISNFNKRDNRNNEINNKSFRDTFDNYFYIPVKLNDQEKKLQANKLFKITREVDQKHHRLRLLTNNEVVKLLNGDIYSKDQARNFLDNSSAGEIYSV